MTKFTLTKKYKGALMKQFNEILILSTFTFGKGFLVEYFKNFD